MKGKTIRIAYLGVDGAPIREEFRGQLIGYKFTEGCVSVWNNDRQEDFTLIVPVQRLVSLEQTNR